MKTAFASLALCALITGCGAANSSAVKAANPLAGSVAIHDAEAKAFAMALTNSGVIRQGADIGAFFIRAASVSCTAADACVVVSDTAELTAPSSAATILAATLKKLGAAAKAVATNVTCVSYVNPRVSSSCRMFLAK